MRGTHGATDIRAMVYAVLLLNLTVHAAGKGKTVKLLTVGNSFAWNAAKYLERIVQSVPGCRLLLASANVGGGPLKQHWSMVEESERDPGYKPYDFRHPVTHQYSRVNLKEALQALDWDIVTMQQYSAHSYRRETYEPYFGRLYRYIRTYAPHAKIYIHQTWAYRADAGRFRAGNFNQRKMYDQLTANYLYFARKYRCPVLPSGAAFQLCRERQDPPFTFPDPAFDYEHPPKGALPRQPGSLNVGWRWTKDGKFILDTHHANDRGCYLAGCTWFEVLFGIDARRIAFTPEELDADDAGFLRAIAHETVTEFGRRIAGDGFPKNVDDNSK